MVKGCTLLGPQLAKLNMVKENAVFCEDLGVTAELSTFDSGPVETTNLFGCEVSLSTSDRKLALQQDCHLDRSDPVVLPRIIRHCRVCAAL